jgi:hypothetical protein
MEISDDIKFFSLRLLNLSLMFILLYSKNVVYAQTKGTTLTYNTIPLGTIEG